MQTQRTCPQCGSPFMVTSKNPHQVNCSRPCADAGRKARCRVEKPCGHCGAMFVTKRHEVARGGGKYCSRACADAERPGFPPDHAERMRIERKGSGNPAFRGDRIGLAAAHDRVRALRGYAREHKCVECGGQARDWALSHDVEETCVAPRTGRLYSLNIDDYMPMCRRCHVHYDHGGEFQRYFGANARWATS
jgi:hypothetical protein